MAAIARLGLVATSVLLVACGAPGAPAAPPITPDAVAASLRASGLPVSGVVVHTPETDPNHLLGRPGQYTGKIDFHDERGPRDEGTMWANRPGSRCARTAQPAPGGCGPRRAP
jgi:hypothetical protein